MPEPKTRGRKPTGNALTGAERQRRYMERLKAGVNVVNVVTDANRAETLERELAQAKRTIAQLQQQLGAREHLIEQMTRDQRLADEAMTSTCEHRDQLSRIVAKLEARLRGQEGATRRAERECKILALRLAGTSTRGIGRELGISDSAVRNALLRHGVG
ncbi:hypothetical protein [Thiorhodococcus minor]|uniref:Uncharacterized protein n=1 Tax=Thiorhodococcus minor TaxID=57489 RepID=A0A6M0JVG2_9GAMM|nr:hypothetical protein [Thiorhodococcus minor]NEV61532.1 hypothetical protein [Thiorhodococcus minor]